MISEEVSKQKGKPVIRNLTGIFLLGTEELLDLLANLAVRKLDIVLGVTIIRHQGKETIIRDIELVMKISTDGEQNIRATHELHLTAGDVGHVHVMRGGAQFFEFLAGEDVQGDKMHLGVTVLSRLGGGHVDDLAGTALDHNVAVLAQRRTLHREGGGSTGIGAAEIVFMLQTIDRQHSLHTLRNCDSFTLPTTARWGPAAGRGTRTWDNSHQRQP